MKPGDVVDGKYEMIRLIGRGGMGSVWEARHTRTKQRLALKLLLPDLQADVQALERFVLEAQAAASIGSPHIVFITDAGDTADNTPYMVMEYLDGEDLASLMEREGPMEPRRAAGLVLQACSALSAAHAKGIIHRDIKPANLYVVSQQHGTELVKVLDFGIARIQDTTKQLTSTHAVLGTIVYMSPEQAESSKGVDARADVYSLGVTFYEMLSGTQPYDAGSFKELLVHIMMGRQKPIEEVRPDLPEQLAAIVTKAIASEKNERYASMDELGGALEQYLAAAAQTSAAHSGAPALAPTASASVPVTVAPAAGAGGAPPPTAVAEARGSAQLPPTSASSMVGLQPQTLAPPYEEPPAPRTGTALKVAIGFVLVLAIASGAVVAWMLTSGAESTEEQQQTAVVVPAIAQSPVADGTEQAPTQPPDADGGAHKTQRVDATPPEAVDPPRPKAGSATPPSTRGKIDRPPSKGRAQVQGQPSSARVSGSLDRSDIQRHLRKSNGRIRACYQRGLNENPSLRGRITVRFTVAPSGRVSSASITSSTLADPAVGRCMVTVIRGIRFPEPRGGGMVIITYPYVFEPS